MYDRDLFKIRPLIEKIKEISITIEDPVDKYAVLNEIIKNKLENFKTDAKIFEDDNEYRDICYLKNGYFLLANENPWKLDWYDSNLNFTMRFNDLLGKAIYPHCVTTDNMNMNIYFANSDQVVMTDYDFNFVKSINSNEIGFSFTSSIDYNNNRLFLCDFHKKRILIFTPDLILYDSFELYFKPVQIKVEKNIACIRSFDFNSIHFYDLTTFRLLRKYYGHCGTISFIGSIFYEFDVGQSKIYCYNKYGDEDKGISSDALSMVMAKICKNTDKSLNDGKIVYCIKQNTLVILLRDKNNKSLILKLV
jgi:hypothetical protein